MAEYSDDDLMQLARKAAESQEKAKVLYDYDQRVIKYFNERNFDGAIAALNDALRIDPNNVIGYYKRGQAYYEKMDYEKSISDYTNAINFCSVQGDQYNIIGEVREAKERAERKVREAKERVEWAERYAKEKAEREAREKEQREREKETAEKLSKAADQGDANAQYELGLLYISGKGVLQNSVKAKELITKAAEQGNTKAKDYLAKKKINNIGLILQISLCAVYFFFLYGTDIIRTPWVADKFNFMRCLPFIIFCLAIGIVSLIFLRKSGYVSGILLLMGMILVQSITICVWKGNVGILLVFFLGRLIINILCAIPGAIIELIVFGSEQK